MEILNLLLDRPLVLGIILAIGATMGMAVERFVTRADAARRKAYWRKRNARNRNSNRSTIANAIHRQTDASDLAYNQLKTVSSAKFTPRALLNRAESKVFHALDVAVIARNPRWQVMAQVSLGEFLASPDKKAFFAINSKRVDFAVMDENCRVVHAIEYQGSGHYAGDNATARDAVKKEALRRAGIGFHEVVAGHTTPGDLKALVDKLVPNARGSLRDLRLSANEGKNSTR